MAKPKQNLPAVISPEERKILRESFIKAFGEKGSAKREAEVQRVARAVGKFLKQELKMHKGEYWLWTFGNSMRPLTDEEIADAVKEGRITNA